MNDFSGTVNFNLFLDMKNLTFLGLAKNKLSVLITESSSIASTANETVPKFEFLLLGSCNLTSFPDFLRHQDRLKFLGLRHNQIHGKVPNWFWNTSIETFLITDNFFTGFGVDVLPSRSLRILDFSKNSFTGALPIPPPSTTYFDGSKNELSGEISPSFFNLSSLELLDLSYNNLSGVLPECSINSNHDLSTAGDSKPYFSFGSQLQLLDLSYNQFRGYLPRSLLANCIELRVFKLENNHFNDVFPSWLGTLPKLRLLVLRSNHLHGEITSKSTSDHDFPSLQIMDLSHNNLSGLLPSHYFQKWNAMKYFDASELPNLGSMNYLTKLSGWTFKFLHRYTVSITNKGRELDYEKIEDVFRVIDLSSNKFQGDIPKCVGNLQGLQVLNLSNNILNGTIPSSLSNITQLESLDLSHNMLSGKIPQQLVQLTFLVSFDVSFNRLIGPIPQGSQFSTFDGSSYAGNTGLWGFPLPRPNTPSAPPLGSGSDEEGHDSRSWFESNWMVIVPGFVGGLIFGVAIEHVLAIDRRDWFIRALTVGIAIKNKARKGRILRRTT
ncbi:hypothetical protein TIFTF001_029543 [Ficus carica]|uniref:Uncharacterized protein n=1 Tax=Ficus carica TaxID=3494 RepID=A0AA88DS22_FICCA|nr:hypothetical protein TIFTF001_029543 [Ficus carica]